MRGLQGTGAEVNHTVCLFQERDQDKERIVELIRQNSQLEFDRKLFLGENCSVDDQLQRASANADSGNLSKFLLEKSPKNLQSCIRNWLGKL